MITAPAAFSRWTGTAFSVGHQSLKAGMPQVVGRPATLNDSFTVIGRPSNRRRSPRASAGGAAAGVAAERASVWGVLVGCGRGAKPPGPGGVARRGEANHEGAAAGGTA